MAIENTVSSDFYPRSSIVKSVFDCRLSAVVTMYLIYVERPSIFVFGVIDTSGA